MRVDELQIFSSFFVYTRRCAAAHNKSIPHPLLIHFLIIENILCSKWLKAYEMSLQPAAEIKVK
jgi:hypothetical protein